MSEMVHELVIIDGLKKITQVEFIMRRFNFYSGRETNNHDGVVCRNVHKMLNDVFREVISDDDDNRANTSLIEC